MAPAARALAGRCKRAARRAKGYTGLAMLNANMQCASDCWSAGNGIPIRVEYWSAVAWVVGISGFVAFPSGRRET